MSKNLRARFVLALSVPLLAASVSACDIVTADFKSEETAEWRKTYDLQSGGRVEVSNVNGKIDVEPSRGNTVEVVAVKVAKAGSPDAARQALERIEIVDSSSADGVRIETKVPRGGGLFGGGNTQVRYTVKVPASASTKFATTNGGIEVLGLEGQTELQTTNGGIRARAIGGAIRATTTNGGVEVDVTRVAGSGIHLECTNGGISLRLPPDARATISASVSNGGIDTSGLSLDTSESTRRNLEARLNGGGPNVRIEGTNGGIRIAARQ